MIQAGNATVFVTDMDRAIDFYTNVLGMKLRARYENHWAEVEVKDLVIGLHPKTDNSPAPGTPGAIQIGLSVEKSLDDVVSELTKKGVNFTGPIIDDKAGRFVSLGDPDGNPLYFWQTTHVSA